MRTDKGNQSLIRSLAMSLMWALLLGFFNLSNSANAFPTGSQDYLGASSEVTNAEVDSAAVRVAMAKVPKKVIKKIAKEAYEQGRCAALYYICYSFGSNSSACYAAKLTAKELNCYNPDNW